MPESRSEGFSFAAQSAALEGVTLSPEQRRMQDNLLMMANIGIKKISDGGQLGSYEVDYKGKKVGETNISSFSSDTEFGVLTAILNDLKDLPIDAQEKLESVKEMFSSANEINQIKGVKLSFTNGAGKLELDTEQQMKCQYSIDGGKTYPSAFGKSFNLTGLRQVRVLTTGSEKIITVQDKQGKNLLLKIPN